jgi:phosphoglycolate phosphatase
VSRLADVVLLDLDGTLSDSRPGISACFRFTLSELGHDPAKSGDLSWAVGPPIAVSIARLLAQFDDDRVEQGLKIYRERYSSVGIYECSIFPGVVEMLMTLQGAGCLMHVATSKRRDFADRVIDYLALRSYVGSVYGAVPGGGLDEKQDLIAHIIQHEGLTASRTIMLGDRLHDIRAARYNNMRGVGALWGYGGLQELKDAGADMIADAPAAVGELLLA